MSAGSQFYSLRWRLLAVVVLMATIYALGIFYIRYWHTHRINAVLQNQVRQNREFFDRLLELKGKSLYTVSYDYTFWDDMVEFVDRPDSQWAQENLDESLSTYDAHAVWVYDTKFSPVYFTTSLDSDRAPIDMPDLLEPYRRVLAKGRFVHFFVPTVKGVVEIRGATIHPSADDERLTTPQGYFFAGRLWDPTYLAELGHLVGGRINVNTSGSFDGGTHERFDKDGVMFWTRTLPGWNSQPVAALAIQVYSPQVHQLIQTTNLVHVLSAVLTFVLLCIVAWVLAKWVAIPLRQISLSLTAENTGPIEPMMEGRSEIGHISRLIRRFLQQKEELVREMEQRQKAEHEREVLESQLRRAQRLETIGTLAGGVAHDFNNILTPILGYADMAMSQLDRKSPMRSDIEHIAKAATRAKDLVRQILAFSRQGEQERVPISLRTVVDEVVKLVRVSVPANVDLREDLGNGRETVLCDPSQIHQVLMNLCTNAFQAMEEGGGILEVTLDTIDVDAEFSCLHLNLNEGRYARLSVTDTGCGMDRATAERIFEPFFTTKPAGKGTGLGLSVAHGIVMAHGGSITAYSEPGRGTTFRVYLPLMDNEQIERADGVPDLEKGTEHVLLVDDEKAIALMGQDMLERLGYQVTTRTSSVEALDLFRMTPHRFDLVVTDQTMPNLTGDRLAGELLKIRSDIPIVMITGFSERITDQNFRKFGIREFVMKPLLAKDLSAAIRRALEPEEMAVA